MIIVKLQGGLGNQMFQYAAARSLTEKGENVNLDVQFFKHTKSTETFTARQYELDVFTNLKTCKANNSLLKMFTGNTVYYKVLRWFYKPVFIQQKENEFIQLTDLPASKYKYLNGYFQSEKYFKHIRNQLLKEFTFPELDEKNAATRKQITGTENSVSIHIRRGDYLKPIFKDVHGILPLEYYTNALYNLEKEITKPNLFVFSDDMNWAKESFKQYSGSICFVENNTAKEAWKDMALMSACKHHIIANSSFSWWGAWLSEGKGKTFAPCNWFNPLQTNFNIHDFIPSNWMIIHYG